MGKRFDCTPVDSNSLSCPWWFADQPGFHGYWGIVGDPGDQRIWRLVADDPTTLRPTPRASRWTCRSATVVEELSPAIVMPAWPEVVRLCARVRALTHDEVVSIAETLIDPPDSQPVGASTEAGWWAAWSVEFAARAADTTQRPVMHYKTDGNTYDVVDHPSWNRVEFAAIALADGLASGVATLAADGERFGPWPTAAA